MAFDIASLPIIIGLIGVGIAVAHRAWKTFEDKKKENPDLKFDVAYLTNALIASGTFVTIITGVIPVVVDEVVPFPSGLVTIGLVIANFSIGYFGTYRVLDGLNNTTSTKIEIAQLKEQVEDES